MAGSESRRIPRRARGRLLVQRPAPREWLPGWTPPTPVRRCACGGHVVARSARFTRCDRGCVRFTAPSPRPQSPRLPPPPPPPRFARILGDLKHLSRDFVADARKGRRVSARAVALAVQAAERLAAEYPDLAPDLWGALPWLRRRRAETMGRAA